MPVKKYIEEIKLTDEQRNEIKAKRKNVGLYAYHSIININNIDYIMIYNAIDKIYLKKTGKGQRKEYFINL